MRLTPTQMKRLISDTFHSEEIEGVCKEWPETKLVISVVKLLQTLDAEPDEVFDWSRK